MNWDQIQGDWKQMTGQVKEKWGKLTDSDLTVIAGKRDQLAGLLQQRYGYAKEKAEKELDDFLSALKPASTKYCENSRVATARCQPAPYGEFVVRSVQSWATRNHTRSCCIVHSDQRSHLTCFDRVPNEWSLDR